MMALAAHRVCMQVGSRRSQPPRPFAASGAGGVCRSSSLTTTMLLLLPAPLCPPNYWGHASFMNDGPLYTHLYLKEQNESCPFYTINAYLHLTLGKGIEYTFRKGWRHLCATLIKVLKFYRLVNSIDLCHCQYFLLASCRPLPLKHGGRRIGVL